jgi:hypothetical protein
VTVARKFEWAARPQPWLAFAVLLGLALRVYHYVSNPPVWHDEAALLVNVLGKGFAELLGPLYYSEAGPPLFLWLERAVALTLGDGTFALRLLPFLAGCAAFLVAVALARRLLSPWAVVWFALLLGCSDRLLWHGCEAKPYALDACVAVGLLATFAARRADEERALFRQLALHAALAPFLIFLCFPACFLLGGAALALLPAVRRARSRRVWAAYLLFGLLLGCSFLALVAGPVHAQKDERMLWCWLDNFPDWSCPWAVPCTAAVRLTELFRYACEPTGNILTAFAAVGLAVLWRAGHRRVLALVLLPLGLNALAWLAGQYPFGAARVVVFAAPGALLLVAAGVPPVLGWWARRSRLASVVVGLLVLFPVGQAGYRVVVPWKRVDSSGAAAFVLSHRRASEPVLGTRWEHAYYFRGMGRMYEAVDLRETEIPTAPAGAEGRPEMVTAFWVLHWKEDEQHECCADWFRPRGTWAVAERYWFGDIVVVRLVRAGPAPAAGLTPAAH